MISLAIFVASDKTLNEESTKFFDDFLKSKDLSYVEKNLIVKMKKVDGEWKIKNETEVIQAALGGLSI